MFNKVNKKKNIREQFESVLEQIMKISKEHTIINVCATPTGSSWLGVYNAGLSLFPDNTIGIPQYYSNQVFSENQLAQIGELIGGLQFNQLIYNGYNKYFSKITQNARKLNTSLRVGVIYHGFFAELSGNQVQTKITKSLIEEIKSKNVDKLAFLKQGNSDIFQKIFGVPCHLIYNRNPQPIKNITTENTIGVLTNQSFRKNSATQVIAALSLKTYNVSIFDTNEYDMFDLNNKLIKISHLTHAAFLNRLSQNIINTHVTFSEASGGQVFTESLALGVPCLTALTHGYLNDSQELKKALVVERFDDAWAIAQKMEEVITNRVYLSKLCLDYSAEMNQKADEFLLKYLEA